jgi:hypothetical protein
MTSSHQAHFNSYFKDAITNPHAIARAFRPFMKKHRIDTIAVTGGSGLVAGAAVAALIKDLNLFVVRKPGEKTHNGDRPVGVMGERWVFFDDFVDSGETFNRVMYGVHNSLRVNPVLFESRDGRVWTPEFVGVFEYGKYPEGDYSTKGRFSDPKRVIKRAKDEIWTWNEVDTKPFAPKRRGRK